MRCIIRDEYYFRGYPVAGIVVGITDFM